MQYFHKEGLNIYFITTINLFHNCANFLNTKASHLGLLDSSGPIQVELTLVSFRHSSVAMSYYYLILNTKKGHTFLKVVNETVTNTLQGTIFQSNYQ